ncbi:MAG: phosphatidylserine/phosphatidylglycerophosphate/cardiolipin synthase family protein [Deltaproteobacteria bacterium]|nr:phosphatidylserine/phosphatidylglycerophosphate/cardiolipin synthase family protein [Deltaproteobacteria bacterium]
MRRTTILGLATMVAFACATPRLGDKELPPRPPSLRAAFEQMPAPASARLRILSDNVDAWVARWRLIESAQRSVDVQYFIIEPDAFGMSLLGLLCEKANAGVKVRLMVDSRGTAALSRTWMGADWLQELVRAGAEVRIYNPLEHNVADALASGDLRAVTASNHDKLIIVDKGAAIAGGRNISRDYLSDTRDHPSAFIDMDVFMEGDGAVRALGEAFSSELRGPKTKKVKRDAGTDDRDGLLLAAAAMRLWLQDPAFSDGEVAALDSDEKRDALALVYEGNAVGALDHIPTDKTRELAREVSRQLARLPHLRGALHRPVPPISVEGESVRVLDTHSSWGPTQRNRVNENLLAAVQAAEREVVIQSPYFVLTERGVRALREAAARGVVVTILTNSPTSSDSPITQAAFLKQWPRLLAEISTARLFVVGEKRLMHAKVGVMDGVLSFVGSYNLDPLSAGVNGEVVAAVWSEQFAASQRALIVGKTEEQAPLVFEYTIERGPDGAPVLEGGEPKVRFGPEQHCDPAAIAKVKKLEPLLELLAPII